MKTQPQSLHCFGPRRREFDLEPFPAAIFFTLRNARGIFVKAGFSATAIRNALVRDNVALASAITVEHVKTELRKLKGLGLVEQLASAPERWRVAR